MCIVAAVSEAKGIKGKMPRIIVSAPAWMARLLAVASVGLMLGACSKCDVPTWPPASAAVPLSCHSDVPVR